MNEKPVCDGSGARCNPSAFGGGYYPSIKARCPACGKWADATEEGSQSTRYGTLRFGTILPHTPKGWRQKRPA